MSCKRPKFPVDQDPDYESIVIQENKRIKLLEKEANDASIKKIQNIIKTQFGQAIASKEVEIDMADQRLHQARIMLDGLRAYVVASYYSSSEKFPGDSVRNSQTYIHPAIKRVLGGKAPHNEHMSKRNRDGLFPQFENNLNSQMNSLNEQLTSNSASLSPLQEQRNDSAAHQSESPKQPIVEESTSDVVSRGSRFKINKTIIVGNVAEYIEMDKRDQNDRSTHKWIVYVRGPKDEPNIDSYVKEVKFMLHRSYDSDVVHVKKPPFRVTRRGWGEFPVRAQIHFHDPRNKPVDIIHMLKLGRTLTAIETSVSETTAKLLLYKRDENKASNIVDNAVQPCIKMDTTKTNNYSANFESLHTSNVDENLSKTATTIIKQELMDEENFTNSEPVMVNQIVLENSNRNCISTQSSETVVDDGKKDHLSNSAEASTPMTKIENNVLSNQSYSHNLLNNKVVIVSPKRDIHSSAVEAKVMLNVEKPQSISSSSPASSTRLLLPANSVGNVKPWSGGVSLLQKSKTVLSKSNATSQPVPQEVTRLVSSTGNAKTLLIVPTAANKQELSLGVNSTVKNFTTAVTNNVKRTVTPAVTACPKISPPLLLISSPPSSSPLKTNLANLTAALPEARQLIVDSTNSSRGQSIIVQQTQQNQLVTVSPQRTPISLIKPQNDPSNSYVTYVKCINQQGELFLVPETLLKLPLQNPVPSKGPLLPDGDIATRVLNVAETSITSSKSSAASLPMYHLQVMPTTNVSTQPQLVPLSTPRGTVGSTTPFQSKRTAVRSLLLGHSLSTVPSSLTSHTGCLLPDVESPKKGVDIEAFSSVEDVVHSFVKLNPLIDQNCDRTLHPYCASSVDVFFSWGIGKQRAVEWQRAKAVQKAMREAFQVSCKWKNEKVWSAKTILWWCRRFGYSPMKNEIPKDSAEETKSEIPACTYSEVEKLVDSLKNFKNDDAKLNNVNDDIEINVVDVDEPICATVPKITESLLQSQCQHLPDTVHLASNPEIELVKEVASKIGVKLKSIEVYPGVMANVVEEMILAASKLFVENIVRNSLSIGFQRLEGKRCPNDVTMEDVYQCIQTLPVCDFLTNSNIGKNVVLQSSSDKSNQLEKL